MNGTLFYLRVQLNVTYAVYIPITPVIKVTVTPLIQVTQAVTVGVLSRCIGFEENIFTIVKQRVCKSI